MSSSISNTPNSASIPQTHLSLPLTFCNTNNSMQNTASKTNELSQKLPPQQHEKLVKASFSAVPIFNISKSLNMNPEAILGIEGIAEILNHRPVAMKVCLLNHFIRAILSSIRSSANQSIQAIGNEAVNTLTELKLCLDILSNFFGCTSEDSVKNPWQKQDRDEIDKTLSQIDHCRMRVLSLVNELPHQPLDEGGLVLLNVLRTFGHVSESRQSYFLLNTQFDLLEADVATQNVACAQLLGNPSESSFSRPIQNNILFQIKKTRASPNLSFEDDDSHNLKINQNIMYDLKDIILANKLFLENKIVKIYPKLNPHVPPFQWEGFFDKIEQQLQKDIENGCVSESLLELLKNQKNKITIHLDNYGPNKKYQDGKFLNEENCKKLNSKFFQSKKELGLNPHLLRLYREFIFQIEKELEGSYLLCKDHPVYYQRKHRFFCNLNTFNSLKELYKDTKHTRAQQAIEAFYKEFEGKFPRFKQLNDIFVKNYKHLSDQDKFARLFKKLRDEDAFPVLYKIEEELFKLSDSFFISESDSETRNELCDIHLDFITSFTQAMGMLLKDIQEWDQPVQNGSTELILPSFYYDLLCISLSSMETVCGTEPQNEASDSNKSQIDSASLTKSKEATLENASAGHPEISPIEKPFAQKTNLTPEPTKQLASHRWVGLSSDFADLVPYRNEKISKWLKRFQHSTGLKLRIDPSPHLKVKVLKPEGGEETLTMLSHGEEHLHQNVRNKIKTQITDCMNRLTENKTLNEKSESKKRLTNKKIVEK